MTVDRVFLDANVLFAGAWRPDTRLRQLWKLPGVRLLTSVYAVEEALRNLETPVQRADLEILTQGMEIVASPDTHQPLPPGIHLPAKDRPILLAAIAARATHLLTGDYRHFRRYYGKIVAGIIILTPGEYLRSRPG